MHKKTYRGVRIYWTTTGGELVRGGVVVFQAPLSLRHYNPVIPRTCRRSLSLPKGIHKSHHRKRRTPGSSSSGLRIIQTLTRPTPSLLRGTPPYQGESFWRGMTAVMAAVALLAALSSPAARAQTDDWGEWSTGNITDKNQTRTCNAGTGNTCMNAYGGGTTNHGGTEIRPSETFWNNYFVNGPAGHTNATEFRFGDRSSDITSVTLTRDNSNGRLQLAAIGLNFSNDPFQRPPVITTGQATPSSGTLFVTDAGFNITLKPRPNLRWTPIPGAGVVFYRPSANNGVVLLDTLCTASGDLRVRSGPTSDTEHTVQASSLLCNGGVSASAITKQAIGELSATDNYIYDGWGAWSAANITDQNQTRTCNAGTGNSCTNAYGGGTTNHGGTETRPSQTFWNNYLVNGPSGHTDATQINGNDITGVTLSRNTDNGQLQLSAVTTSSGTTAVNPVATITTGQATPSTGTLFATPSFNIALKTRPNLSWTPIPGAGVVFYRPSANNGVVLLDTLCTASGDLRVRSGQTNDTEHTAQANSSLCNVGASAAAITKQTIGELSATDNYIYDVWGAWSTANITDKNQTRTCNAGMGNTCTNAYGGGTTPHGDTETRPSQTFWDNYLVNGPSGHTDATEINGNDITGVTLSRNTNNGRLQLSAVTTSSGTTAVNPVATITTGQATPSSGTLFANIALKSGASRPNLSWTTIPGAGVVFYRPPASNAVILVDTLCTASGDLRVRSGQTTDTEHTAQASSLLCNIGASASAITKQTIGELNATDNYIYSADGWGDWSTANITDQNQTRTCNAGTGNTCTNEYGGGTTNHGQTETRPSETFWNNYLVNGPAGHTDATEINGNDITGVTLSRNTDNGQLQLSAVTTSSGTTAVNPVATITTGQATPSTGTLFATPSFNIALKTRPNLSWTPIPGAGVVFYRPSANNGVVLLDTLCTASGDLRVRSGQTNDTEHTAQANSSLCNIGTSAAAITKQVIGELSATDDYIYDVWGAWSTANITDQNQTRTCHAGTGNTCTNAYGGGTTNHGGTETRPSQTFWDNYLVNGPAGHADATETNGEDIISVSLSRNNNGRLQLSLVRGSSTVYGINPAVSITTEQATPSSGTLLVTGPLASRSIVLKPRPNLTWTPIPGPGVVFYRPAANNTVVLVDTLCTASGDLRVRSGPTSDTEHTAQANSSLCNVGASAAAITKQAIGELSDEDNYIYDVWGAWSAANITDKNQTRTCHAGTGNTCTDAYGGFTTNDGGTETRPSQTFWNNYLVNGPAGHTDATEINGNDITGVTLSRNTNNGRLELSAVTTSSGTTAVNPVAPITTEQETPGSGILFATSPHNIVLKPRPNLTWTPIPGLGVVYANGGVVLVDTLCTANGDLRVRSGSTDAGRTVQAGSLLCNVGARAAAITKQAIGELSATDNYIYSVDWGEWSVANITDKNQTRTCYAGTSNRCTNAYGAGTTPHGDTETRPSQTFWNNYLLNGPAGYTDATELSGADVTGVTLSRNTNNGRLQLSAVTTPSGTTAVNPVAPITTGQATPSSGTLFANIALKSGASPRPNPSWTAIPGLGIVFYRPTPGNDEVLVDTLCTASGDLRVRSGQTDAGRTVQANSSLCNPGASASAITKQAIGELSDADNYIYSADWGAWSAENITDQNQTRTCNAGTGNSCTNAYGAGTTNHGGTETRPSQTFWNNYLVNGPVGHTDATQINGNDITGVTLSRNTDNGQLQLSAVTTSSGTTAVNPVATITTGQATPSSGTLFTASPHNIVLKTRPNLSWTPIPGPGVVYRPSANGGVILVDTLCTASGDLRVRSGPTSDTEQTVQASSPLCSLGASAAAITKQAIGELSATDNYIYSADGWDAWSTANITDKNQTRTCYAGTGNTCTNAYGGGTTNDGGTETRPSQTFWDNYLVNGPAGHTDATEINGIDIIGVPLSRNDDGRLQFRHIGVPNRLVGIATEYITTEQATPSSGILLATRAGINIVLKPRPNLSWTPIPGLGVVFYRPSANNGMVLLDSLCTPSGDLRVRSGQTTDTEQTVQAESPLCNYRASTLAITKQAIGELSATDNYLYAAASVTLGAIQDSTPNTPARVDDILTAGALSHPTLTVNISAHQWQRCTTQDCSSATDISTNGTSATYTVQAADHAHWLRVQVTQGGDFNDTRFSNILRVDRGGVLGPITGNARAGDTLTAGAVTDPDASPNTDVGTITWQWQTATASAGPFTAAPGTNNTATYTIASDQSQIGTWLRVMASYPNAGGDSLTSDPVVVAGVRVSPTTLAVDEAGSGTYTLALTKRPTVPVTLTVSNPDATAVNLSATSLTFTTDNWNSTQTVTVSGVEDTDADHETVQLTHTATSTDADYASGVTIDSVAVTLNDNDTPGVAVSTTTLTVHERGGTGMYTLRLNTPPTEAVTISVTHSNAAAVTVSPTSLMFGTTDWNTAKTITVTGVEDADTDDETVRLTHTVTSTDTTYRTVTAATVTVTVTETAAVNLDVDGSGGDPNQSDGLLLGRYLFGIRDAAGLLDTIPGSPSFNAVTTNIAGAFASGRLDVDGSGGDPNQSDGLLLGRYLFGIRDAVGLLDTIPGNPSFNAVRTNIEALLQ